MTPEQPAEPPVPTAAATATTPGAAAGEPVEVRRSARRRRTVTAYRSEGRIVVLLPARLSQAEEAIWVERMVTRLTRREERAEVGGDAVLQQRAEQLSERWLEGRARPRSVRWSDRQQRRWGSCSVDAGTIRLSRRLAAMPAWVVDYVLVHELTHLLVADHSAEFHALVGRYPDTVRAQAFLAGVEHGAGYGPRDEPAADDGDDGDEDGDLRTTGTAGA